MRKFGIILLLITGFFFFSCTVDDQSEIKIDVSTIPVTVVKLHVAILSGESIIQQKSFLRSEIGSDGSIELSASPGNNREIILVAENSSGQVDYFGTAFADLMPGQVVVNIAMKTPATGIAFQNNNAMSPALKIVSWSNCGTLTKYYFRETTYYYWSGYETSVQYYTPFSATSHYLAIEYEFCDLKSAEVLF